MSAAGIYIHIPFCKSRCAYCSFVSRTDLSGREAYVRALCCELKDRSDGTSADTVYIGGGTPSVLPPRMLTEILSDVRRYYRIARDAEITVECNPDSATREFLSACAESGVNRLSFGLQAADDALLRAVGRPHTTQDFLRAVEDANRAGIDNLSADIMLGLPGQTMKHLKTTLRLLAGLPLKHISLYALTVEENTPLSAKGYSADEDLQAEMYDACLSYLPPRGFERYEVSNFAVKGFESRHNGKYWDMTPYLGFGAAAHSFDGVNVRRANTDSVSRYILGDCGAAVTELTEADLKTESIMLGLRTADGIDLEAYRRRFGVDLLDEKADKIAEFISLGLLERAGERLRLTYEAFYVMNTVIVGLI